MSARVDVLAVMARDAADAENFRREASTHYADSGVSESSQARAAVAELIDCLRGLLAVYAEPDEVLCCDGRDCGCWGASAYQEAEHYARAALARIGGAA